MASFLKTWVLIYFAGNKKLDSEQTGTRGETFARFQFVSPG